jgi:uncharacterized membrane protein YcaP (DUF421 family)
MTPEEYTFDLLRIFLGEFPPLIYVEILLRTLVMYVYTFILLRILGKRESGTLSPFELVIVISLGSAVGDPMFYPDVPLVHGFTVITAIVVLQRLLENLTNRMPNLEKKVEGKTRLLIKDGVIDRENMLHERISHLELFSALRSKEVLQLGQVYRSYFEPSGDISVFKYAEEETRPGLPIFPADDPASPKRHTQGETMKPATTLACCTCGTVAENISEVSACKNCEGETWVPAIHPTQSQTPR